LLHHGANAQMVARHPGPDRPRKKVGEFHRQNPVLQSGALTHCRSTDRFARFRVFGESKDGRQRYLRLPQSELGRGFSRTRHSPTSLPVPYGVASQVVTDKGRDRDFGEARSFAASSFVVRRAKWAAGGPAAERSIVADVGPDPTRYGHHFIPDIGIDPVAFRSLDVEWALDGRRA
jgi:hypothetical protein